MTLRSGKKAVVTTKAAAVLPRNHALGPRNSGVIYELLSSDAPTSHSLSVTTDIRAKVFGTLTRHADTKSAITRSVLRTVDAKLAVALRRQFDSDVRLTMDCAFAVYADGSLAIVDPELLRPDLRLRICGTGAQDGDLKLSITNCRELRPDSRAVVFGRTDPRPDLRMVVSGAVSLLGDVLAEIDDGILSADSWMTIVGDVDFADDTELAVLRRVAPDTDALQIVYGLLIRESHAICTTGE